MKIHVTLITAVLLLLLSSFFSLSAQAETIRISAAASMSDTIKDLAGLYQKSNPNITILLNFASSGSLAKQIIRGAPADLYISANQKWMEYLLEKKLIAPQTISLLACNKLVFVGQKRSDIHAIEDISSLSLIALGNPGSVPAGQYAAQAMQAAGIYKQLNHEHKLVISKDVRQALLYAERGEVDGAFIYLTDALPAKKVHILFIVAESMHNPITYPVALTRTGAKNSVSRSFYSFLHSPAAINILTKHGFQTITGGMN
jgi:molybdate transport system substrate-binding protein